MSNVSLVDGHIDEPKMTDEEIKKALECCCKSFGNCTKCPYKEVDCVTTSGKSLLLKDALDLINRIQAENKELDDKLVIHKGTIAWQAKEINRKDAEIHILKTEIERLKAEIVIRDKIIDERGKEVIRHDNAIRSLHKQLDNLKTEAIKEVAERLKEKSYLNDGVVYIDDLVKEMVGE